MSKFTEYIFEEVLTLKYGKDQKKVVDKNGDYPILGTGGIMGYANKYLYDKPSVLIGRKGTINKPIYMDTPFWTIDTLFYTEVNEEKVYPKYLYYRFLLINFLQYNEATGVPSLKTHTLNKIPLKIHESIDCQKKIAKIISDLDAKIALNNRINEELEAMAKLLYDYWFVQFDFPNEDGKPYKSSGGEMVYSEVLKREVPLGWEVRKLDDVIEGTRTGLNPRKNFKLGQGDNYYVTIKNIEQGKINLNSKCDKISTKTLEIINKRSDLQAGDILFTSIQPIGVTYLLSEKPQNWNINESVFTIRPNYEKLTSEFLYMFLSGEYIKAYSKNVSTGSIHKGIRHSALKDCPFILPPKSIINYFSQQLNPINEKTHLLNKQSRALKDLRDWLLPMLMNGQVSLEDTQ